MDVTWNSIMFVHSPSVMFSHNQIVNRCVKFAFEISYRLNKMWSSYDVHMQTGMSIGTITKTKKQTLQWSGIPLDNATRLMNISSVNTVTVCDKVHNRLVSEGYMLRYCISQQLVDFPDYTTCNTYTIQVDNFKQYITSKIRPPRLIIP